MPSHFFLLLLFHTYRYLYKKSDFIFFILTNKDEFCSRHAMSPRYLFFLYTNMSVKSIIERPSLLSASSGYENYRGFLNLLYVILGIGSCRLVLENILQYGLLVEFDWPIRFVKDPTNWPSVSCCCFSFKYLFI